MSSKAVEILKYKKFMSIVIFHKLYPNVAAPNEPSSTFKDIVNYKIQKFNGENRERIVYYIDNYVNNIDAMLTHINLGDKEYKEVMTNAINKAADQLIFDQKYLIHQNEFNKTELKAGNYLITLDSSILDDLTTEELKEKFKGIVLANPSFFSKVLKWLGI